MIWKRLGSSNISLGIALGALGFLDGRQWATFIMLNFFRKWDGIETGCCMSPSLSELSGGGSSSEEDSWDASSSEEDGCDSCSSVMRESSFWFSGLRLDLQARQLSSSLARLRSIRVVP